MKPFINFKNRFPVLYALLGMPIFYLTVRFVPEIVSGTYSKGVREIICAIVIFLIWLLFNGRGSAPFSLKGVKESFRFMRVYFIVLAALCALGFIFAGLRGRMTRSYADELINALLIGASVGIVEEFPCRGMVFGGMRAKLGDSPKAVFISAVISGVLFGFIHVVTPLIQGAVSGLLGWAQVLAKTAGAGVIGFIFCYILLNTGNIWAVVILHGVNDLLEFWMSAGSGGTIGEYVKQDRTAATGAIIAGFVCFIIYLPYAIRCVKEYRKRWEEKQAAADAEPAPETAE